MPLHVEALDHVEIVVRDMDAMRAFYGRLTGAEPLETEVAGDELARQTGLPDARQRSVTFTLGGVGIELVQYLAADGAGEPVARPANAVGTRTLAFRVKDAEAACQALQERGVAFVAASVSELGAEAGAMRGIRLAYLHDPEGNLLEIVEPPGVLRRVADAALGS